MAKAQTSDPPVPDAVGIKRLTTVARRRGEADAYLGKRAWLRYTIGMRLEIARTEAGKARPVPVVTHDISGGGIGFWSKRPIPRDGVLFVRAWSEDGSEPWLAAKVVHCTIGIRGYLIGAAFLKPADPDVEVEGGRSRRSQIGRPGFGHGHVFAVRRSLQVKCAAAAAIAGGLGATATIAMAGAWVLHPAALWPWALLPAAGALLAGVVIGWLVVAPEARFVDRFRATIRRLAGGDVRASAAVEAPCRELAALQGAFLELGEMWRKREDDERHQREKLEDLNQIKSNILAIVSHDLRTPLTSILLYARMLSEELGELEAKDQRRFLEIISDECNRLSRLVDDLLEVQRLDAGRAKWKMESCDLSKTIRACARVFEAMAHSKSIRLTVDCPDVLPPVEADADRISQVLSNLLSNALKYTPSGGAVRLVAETSPGQIVLRVADTGPGIPRDKWDQIFERFVQLSNPDKREIAGVGLGLYIVKQIVERHGGAVWVNSEPGAGSEFFVSLPSLTARAADAPPPAPDACPGRVLVCDADPELAAMIAQTLRAQRFDVRTAHSGCRLLSQLAQGDTDVVVTDVLLPDMSAHELLDGLAAIADRRFRLVVHSFADDGPELRRRGVDVFLARPASRQDLIQAVRVAMRMRAGGSAGNFVLVRNEKADLRAINKLLAERGHIPITAESLDAAAGLIRDYPVDAVVIAETMLGEDWDGLARLGIAADGGIPVLVLCRAIRKAERRLAEERGVQVVEYGEKPGDEEAVVAAMLASRRPLMPETV